LVNLARVTERVPPLAIAEVKPVVTVIVSAEEPYVGIALADI
jgi:hypothetical protein